jgi:hypothetical protein
MGIARRPRDPLGDRPARISETAARQLARQAGRVYRDIPISVDRGQGLGVAAPMAGLLVPAVVTTAITACSTASTPVPGTGQAQLWYYDDDTAAMASNPDGDDGPSGISGGIVTVLNWYTGAGTIPAGKHIWLAVFGNAYWILTADC